MILDPKGIKRKVKFKKLYCEFEEETTVNPVEGMNIQELPPIFYRNGRECYLDPIREKLIYVTPEETVRQRVIAYLINELKVPKKMIDVEEPLSHYGISTRKRADIIVHKFNKNDELVPILVIECKAPTVCLGEKAQKQMLNYCESLYSDYAMMINGWESYCYKQSEDQNEYLKIEQLPVYTKMLQGYYDIWEEPEKAERIPFEEIEEHLKLQFETFESPHAAEDISPLTDMKIAVPAFNLMTALQDENRKLPVGDYGLFRLIEDYGVRKLSYGNASGGVFSGPYRSFLIDINGNTEFISMNISTYWKSSNPDKVCTCLSVAIDNEKDTHHSLQFVFDDNLKVDGEKCDFFHHGRIAIGNMGCGKIEELRMFVEERYPEIISGKRFYLGNLTNNRLWYLDDPELVLLTKNLISYAIIRDEYRAYKKQSKK